nr:hypothetical protein [uncultured Undibacterium sp.]
MSDIVDKADLVVSMFTEAAVKLARKDQFINNDGHCLFCDELVMSEMRFCNIDCRDDFEKELAVLKISGCRQD